ncbi:MAG: hypothetical protein ACQZ3N_08690, partial [cyanobacterium endosymbiont of Rhopalodia yunnanensis]
KPYYLSKRWSEAWSSFYQIPNEVSKLEEVNLSTIKRNKKVQEILPQIVTISNSVNVNFEIKSHT